MTSMGSLSTAHRLTTPRSRSFVEPDCNSFRRQDMCLFVTEKGTPGYRKWYARTAFQPAPGEVADPCQASTKLPRKWRVSCRVSCKAVASRNEQARQNSKSWRAL